MKTKLKSLTLYISAVISFIAIATYTVPTIRFIIICAREDRCRRFPRESAMRLIMQKTKREEMTNTKPRITICNMRDPLEGSENWGRNERKNMDTLGFVIFIIIPRLYS